MPTQHDFEVGNLKVARITFAGMDGEYAVMEPARGTSGEVDRLSIRSLKGGMEIEVEPAPDFDPKSQIVSQILLNGKNRGSWRKRGSVTVFADSDGGEAMYIDSSTTGGAPSGEIGMPVVYRIYGEGENVKSDIVFHPSDNTIELKDYDRNVFVRKTLEDWLKSSFDEL